MHETEHNKISRQCIISTFNEELGIKHMLQRKYRPHVYIDGKFQLRIEIVDPSIYDDCLVDNKAEKDEGDEDDSLDIINNLRGFVLKHCSSSSSADAETGGEPLSAAMSNLDLPLRGI